MKAFLSLGSNKSDRVFFLQQALEKISQIASILSTSQVYQTAAWGNSSLDDFYNLVAEVDTEFSPEDFMRALIEIEEHLGRHRIQKWEAREIDIDILFCEDLVLKTESLTVPHPYLHERAFVLRPLVDIAPDFMHPILFQSMNQLLSQCTDQLAVEPVGHLIKFSSK